MWPDTRLLDLFGIELPIVQAPMANATGVEMAVAVAKAGGLGSLPCAMLGTDKIRAGVTEFRAQSNKPFNLNFFCHAAPAEDVARRAGLAHAPCALLHGARRHTAFAPAESRVAALRRGGLRAGRGAEAGDRELSFRPAGASTPPARQICRLQNHGLRHERQGSNLARRARRRRRHRPRRRSRRSSRHVPRDRRRRARSAPSRSCRRSPTR